MRRNDKSRPVGDLRVGLCCRKASTFDKHSMCQRNPSGRLGGKSTAIQLSGGLDVQCSSFAIECRFLRSAVGKLDADLSGF